MQFLFLSEEGRGGRARPSRESRLVDLFAMSYGKLPACRRMISAFRGNTGLLRMCIFLHAAIRVTGEHRANLYK
jgi:hypothetical protein